MIEFTKKDGFPEGKEINLISNNSEFTMLIGANTDLYWVSRDEHEDKVFEISNEDNFWFVLFEQLFNEIKKFEDKYRPTIKDNTFVWISEDFPEEFASKLIITKDLDKFTIKFIINKDKLYSNVCAVCFSNSGSNHVRIQRLFMYLYSNLLKLNEKDYKSVKTKSLLKL